MVKDKMLIGDLPVGESIRGYTIAYTLEIIPTGITRKSESTVTSSMICAFGCQNLQKHHRPDTEIILNYEYALKARRILQDKRVESSYDEGIKQKEIAEKFLIEEGQYGK